MERPEGQNGGAFRPIGEATVVDGGYRVTGQLAAREWLPAF